MVFSIFRSVFTSFRFYSFFSLVNKAYYLFQQELVPNSPIF